MITYFQNSKMIVSILIFSVFLKLILLYVIGVQVLPDSNVYLRIAEEIYQGSFVFPSWENDDGPLTPYIFALVFPLEEYFGLNIYAFENILVTSATIYVIYKITTMIFDNTAVANIASIIYAIYPFFNFYAISILTEPHFIFFVYISLMFFVRFIKFQNISDILLFGVMFALSALVRFSSLAMFPFFLLLIVVLFKNNVGIKKSLIYMSAGALAFFLTMLPWWVRNYQVSGNVSLMTIATAGPMLYMGNNPNNKTGGASGGVDVDFKEFFYIKNQLEREDAMQKAAINWILENPLDWLELEKKKFLRFFSLTLNAEKYRTWYYDAMSILSYGILLLLIFPSLYIFRDKLRLYSPMLLFSFLLIGLHMVLIASVRYRLPIEPFMVIMASPIIYRLPKKVFSK